MPQNNPTTIDGLPILKSKNGTSITEDGLPILKKKDSTESLNGTKDLPPQSEQELQPFKSPTSQTNDKVLGSIYSKYPGLKVLGNVTLKADPNFTRDKTGAGDIEYFSPTQDTVRYSDSYKYPHPKMGTHGIVYNPKTNNEEDIMLDMLHGMAEADPNYAKLHEQFKKQVLIDRGDDAEYFYQKAKKEGNAPDGKEAWMNNYVDGLIRSEISESQTGDYAIERKGNSAALKDIASQIKSYLQKDTFKSPTQILSESGGGGSFFPDDVKGGAALPEPIIEIPKGVVPQYSWNKAAKVIGHVEGLPEKSQEEKQEQVDKEYAALPPVAQQTAIAGLKAWNGSIDILNSTTQFLTGTAFGIGSDELKKGTDEFFELLKQPEPTPEKGITVNNVVGAMGSMFPFLASFAFGSGQIAAASRVLGMGEKAAHITGIVTTNMVLTYNDAYNAAMEAGVDSEIAKNEYALGVTAMGGMLFSVFPALRQIKGFGTPAALSGWGLNALTKSLVEGVPAKEAAKQALKVVGKAVIDNVENTGVMTGVELATKVGQMVSNISTGEKSFDTTIDPVEMGEHFVINALALSPLSAMKGAAAFKERNQMQKQALYYASKDPERYKAELGKMFEEGKISIEQFANANMLIGEVSGAISKIPEGYAEPKVLELIPAFIEKNEATQEKQIAEQKKAGADPLFHPEIQKEVDAAEEKIETKNEEIKNIISEESITEQKKQDTRTEEPTIENVEEVLKVVENVSDSGVSGGIDAAKLNEEHRSLTNKIINQQAYLIQTGKKDFASDKKWNELTNRKKEIEAEIKKSESEPPPQAAPTEVVSVEGKVENKPQSIPTTEVPKDISDKAGGEKGRDAVLPEGEPRDLIGATVVAKKELTGVGGKKKQFEGQVKIVGEEKDSQGNTLYDGRYTDAKGNERSILLRGDEIKTSDLAPKTEQPTPKSEPPLTPKTKLQLAIDKAAESFKAAQENRRKNDQNLGIVKKSDDAVKKQALLDRQAFDDFLNAAREAINEGTKAFKKFAERIPDEAKRIAEIAWKVANNTLKYEDAVGMIESEAMKRELTKNEREAAERLTDNPIKDTETQIPTEEPPKDIGNKEKIRKVFDAFMNRSQINDAAKKLLKENPNNTYVVFNALAKHDVIELSKEIVNRIGVEQALKEATDMQNGLLPRERMLMLGGIVNELNIRVSKANGEKQIELSNQEIDAYNKLIDQATDFAATYATDMGQAIEAIKNIYKMSNISALRVLKKTNDTANEMNAPNAQRTVDAILKDLQDENKHIKAAAEEMKNLDASQKATIEQLQKELQTAIKNAKSKEPRLGSKEKPIKVIKEVSKGDFEAAMKRLGGKLRTGLSHEDLSDLNTISTYVMQKGAGKFSDFFDYLKKSLPSKYHDEIADAYKSARDKSIEAGESKERFDTDEAITDALDTKSRETDAKVITDRTARIAKAKLESQPEKARELAPGVAAKRILQDAKSTLEIGSTKNEKKYLNNLVNAVVSKAQEIYKDKAPTKSSVDDWLRIAIENLRHTDSLWKEAQRKVEEKIDADSKLTESEKDNVKTFLDDYLQSTIDILLTEPKKKEIVRQKLIDAGYFTEVTKDGKTSKAIDWSKIVGNENTIAEAKAKIRSTIEGLGLPKEDTNAVIESIIHQFETTVRDKRATEINKYLNKYNINKAKNVIGKGNRKRNVDKLIEYQDKGILTDERAREVLVKELGLTTITPEEFARVNELVELIRNTKTPSVKKKFEEELEYIFATKNGNFEYELTKSRMLSNALGSIPNMIQNAISGFGITVNQAVSAAIKTGDPIGALKVALRGLDKGWKDAKQIFLEGGVGRGSAFSDYTLTTEGAPRLRILEHKRGGKIFWIVPDIFMKAGKRTFNANDIILNQTGKWTSRVLEATDALNSSPISEISQYVNLFNQIRRDNPLLSKKQIREKAFEEMYKKKMPEAIREATDDLINNAKIPNPTQTQIKRAAYELIEIERREEIVGRGERDAARFTGRKSTYGITTPITWVLQGLQQKIGEAKRLNAASSKYRRFAANTADFTVNTAIPFANGIARWIELQMELVAPYGLLKAGAYKVAAETIKRTPKYQEKYDYREIQSLANTYALRAAIGTTEAIVIGTILASMAEDDEEWIKGIDILETPYGKKQISNIVMPENTVNVKGHNIPLYLIGGMGMSLGLYATLRDAFESQQITPEHFRKSETALTFIALSQILSNIYGERASRFGSLITGWHGKDFDKNFGKFLGRNARNFLPGAQLQYNIYQMLNPQAKESENFHENLLMQTGVYGGWAGKDAFDYRGRPFDIGQASPLTPDGLIKMFEKNERADGIDKLLAKAGYNHNDVDQKNEKYWFVDESGIYYPQDLDEDKKYDFRKLASQKFNDKLTEYQDALQSAANLTDLDYYTPEQIIRRYASILHSLANDEAYKEIMPDAVLSEAELKIEEKFKDLESKLIGLQTGITVPLEIENSLKDIEGVIGTLEQKKQSMQPTE